MLKREKKMLQVRRILVPTDFSLYSDQAVDYAIMLAKNFKAVVTVMHVTEPFPYTMTDPFIMVEHGRTLSLIAQSLLENLRKKLGAKGLTVRTHLVRGIPHHEIVKKAVQDRANMIVMGTHGRTGMEHLLLGSVAEKVVRLAGCPVLTVRSTRGTKRRDRGMS